MPSVTEITVRYAETDCMGVTHHAVYPVWFEVARTDYIKNAAVSYAEMERRGVMIPVTGISQVPPAVALRRYAGDNHLRHEVQSGKGGVPL